MSILKFQGENIEVDENGHLKNKDDWSENLMKFMAREEGMGELDEEQRWIINFFRGYYIEYQAHPLTRTVTKAMGEEFKDKEKGNTKYLYEKFKKGPSQICKLAGVKKPTGCFG